MRIERSICPLTRWMFATILVRRRLWSFLERLNLSQYWTLYRSQVETGHAQHSTRRAPANRSPNVFNGFNEDSSKIIILNMKFPIAKTLGMIY